MAAPRRPARLRLSARSVVTAVALLGLTLVLLRLVAAAGRVLGWVLAAALLAGLLHPAVERLGRRLPRGAALAVVAVLAARMPADEVAHPLDRCPAAEPVAAPA